MMEKIEFVTKDNVHEATNLEKLGASWRMLSVLVKLKSQINVLKE